jgi:hypothetical protein
LVVGHLGWFYILATVNSAVIKYRISLMYVVLHSFGYIKGLFLFLSIYDFFWQGKKISEKGKNGKWETKQKVGKDFSN